jgi:hypothetical protein
MSYLKLHLDPDEHEQIETQQSDIAPETLERNALNFLV